MEKEGYVSVWIGNVQSAESLADYVETKYSSDGEHVGSVFARDFGIGFIDDDFLEAEYFDATLDLDKALEQFSYGTVVMSELSTVMATKLDSEINGAILLYNFFYEPIAGGNLFTDGVRFIGAVAYR